MTTPVLRLLIVEENPTQAKLMEAVLPFSDSHVQYDIEHVSTLRRALEVVASRTFDVALLDLTLPPRDELEAVCAFQAAAPHIPFMVLTAHEDDQLASESLQRGAQDYLFKGTYSGESLGRCIRYAIQRHRWSEELAAANRSLRDREETLKLAIEAGKLVAWDWNRQSDVVTLSAVLPGSTDPSAKSIAAAELRKLVHPEDASTVAAAIEKAIADGRSYQLEYRVRLADGRTRWIADHGLPVENATRLVGITRDITESKEAELLRRKASNFQSSILDALTSQLAVLDDSGRITMVNRAWRTFADENAFAMPNYGVGMNYLDVCAAAIPQDSHAAAVWNGLQRILRGEIEEWTLEYPCHSPVEERWFMLRASRFEWDGKVHVVMSHENITQRHAAEEALKLSQERFQRAVAGTSDGIWDWDVRTGYLWFSPRSEALLGYREGELPLQIDVFWERLHPDDRLLVERALAQHFDGSQPIYSAEYRLRHSSGEYRWFRARGNASRDAAGNPIHMSGALEDITQEREVRAKLRQLAVIVESSGDAILSKSLDGTVLTWNAAAERIYGYSAAEIVGKDIRTIVPADRLEEEEKLLADMSTSTRSIKLDTVRLAKNGKRIEVSLLVSPICDSTGKVVGVSSIHRDETEINAARRALEDKDAQIRQKQKLEAVGSLAGGIAHEFNNLLQAILGYTRFALEGLDAEDPRSEDLHQVVTAGERAAELTKQLLRFGRREEVRKCLASPQEIVTGLAKLLRPLIGEQIELSVVADVQSAAIFADAGLISQMLMNLCLNARDALAGGGKLRLEARSITLSAPLVTKWSQVSPGKYVQFVVQDDGQGMTSEVLERAFEPFFTTKGVGQGTGLGLPMVYGVVQQHDGSINISTAPGQGTRIEVNLPAVDGSAQTEASPLSLPAASTAVTVLVAEDEPLVRDVASRILTRAGYEVITASDGEEAIRLLNSHQGHIHVALLDMVMPKATGRDVFEVLREKHPTTKAIFCSGYAPEPDFGDFVAQHEVALLQKPFRPESLLSAVSCTLRDETCTLS